VILVTGASGFIGSSLCKELQARNIGFLEASRQYSENKNHFYIPNINKDTNWKEPLRHSEKVIHTAARVHVMHDNSEDSLKKFESINLYGTLNLAEQSIQEGVKRFIFLSSIKVNGEETKKNHPFFYDDLVSPQDPYALSKYKAEQQLKDLCKGTPMDLVIVRPPLVYGPGVKGNFASMVKLISLNLPLPFDGITNLRSLVSIYNLTDFLILCAQYEKEINDTLLISDDEDISTTELMKKITFITGKKDLLFSLPNPILVSLFTFINRKKEIQRLTSNLQVDVNHTKYKVGWGRKYSFDQSLKKMFN
tara:strand:+ start:32071 stop:32991 length:921 start_codon:yes stop_codon:yes gene_type:complete